MVFTVSAAVLFALLLGILLKTRTVGFGSALVSLLCGYFLASTGAAQYINPFMSAIGQSIANLG